MKKIVNTSIVLNLDVLITIALMWKKMEINLWISRTTYVRRTQTKGKQIWMNLQWRGVEPPARRTQRKRLQSSYVFSSFSLPEERHLLMWPCWESNPLTRHRWYEEAYKTKFWVSKHQKCQRLQVKHSIKMPAEEYNGKSVLFRSDIRVSTFVTKIYIFAKNK